LLLTVLALLQSRGRQLPNERAQLYAAATETLIESWPAAQRGAQLPLETIPLWLAPLAERAFLAPPSTGTAQDEVVEVLADSRAALFGETLLAARERTRALLRAIERDSGLLSVTGLDEDGQPLWEFLHRSFAEYLVARQRADCHRRGEGDLMELAGREPWREVLLMALGELGRRDPEAASAVLERLHARATRRRPCRSWQPDSGSR
jgi:predicted NACHT family NTPase